MALDVGIWHYREHDQGTTQLTDRQVTNTKNVVTYCSFYCRTIDSCKGSVFFSGGLDDFTSLGCGPARLAGLTAG
jgi:hypothetical protein